MDVENKLSDQTELPQSALMSVTDCSSTQESCAVSQVITHSGATPKMLKSFLHLDPMNTVIKCEPLDREFIKDEPLFSLSEVKVEKVDIKQEVFECLIFKDDVKENFGFKLDATKLELKKESFENIDFLFLSDEDSGDSFCGFENCATTHSNNLEFASKKMYLSATPSKNDIVLKQTLLGNNIDFVYFNSIINLLLSKTKLSLINSQSEGNESKVTAVCMNNFNSLKKLDGINIVTTDASASELECLYNEIFTVDTEQYSATLPALQQFFNMLKQNIMNWDYLKENFVYLKKIMLALKDDSFVKNCMCNLSSILEVCDKDAFSLPLCNDVTSLTDYDDAGHLLKDQLVAELVPDHPLVSVILNIYKLSNVLSSTLQVIEDETTGSVKIINTPTVNEVIEVLVSDEEEQLQSVTNETAVVSENVSADGNMDTNTLKASEITKSVTNETAVVSENVSADGNMDSNTLKVSEITKSVTSETAVMSENVSTDGNMDTNTLKASEITKSVTNETAVVSENVSADGNMDSNTLKVSEITKSVTSETAVMSENVSTDGNMDTNTLKVSEITKSVTNETAVVSENVSTDGNMDSNTLKVSEITKSVTNETAVVSENVSTDGNMPTNTLKVSEIIKRKDCYNNGLSDDSSNSLKRKRSSFCQNRNTHKLKRCPINSYPLPANGNTNYPQEGDILDNTLERTSGSSNDETTSDCNGDVQKKFVLECDGKQIDYVQEKEIIEKEKHFILLKMKEYEEKQKEVEKMKMDLQQKLQSLSSACGFVESDVIEAEVRTEGYSNTDCLLQNIQKNDMVSVSEDSSNIIETIEITDQCNLNNEPIVAQLIDEAIGPFSEEPLVSDKDVENSSTFLLDFENVEAPITTERENMPTEHNEIVMKTPVSNSVKSDRCVSEPGKCATTPVSNSVKSDRCVSEPGKCATTPVSNSMKSDRCVSEPGKCATAQRNVKLSSYTKHSVFKASSLKSCDKHYSKKTMKNLRIFRKDSGTKCIKSKRSCGNINESKINKLMELRATVLPEVAKRSEVSHMTVAIPSVLDISNQDKEVTLLLTNDITRNNVEVMNNSVTEKVISSDNSCINDVTNTTTTLLTGNYESESDGNNMKIVKSSSVSDKKHVSRDKKRSVYRATRIRCNSKKESIENVQSEIIRDSLTIPTTAKKLQNIPCFVTVTAGVTVYCCNLCFYQTNNRHRYRLHHYVHSYTYYKCKHCEFSSTSSAKIYMHEDKHEHKKGFPCDQCSFVYFDKKGLRKHVQTHDLPSPQSPNCTDCSFKCSTFTEVRKHFILVHGVFHTKTRFDCVICEYSASNMKCLQEHLKKHLKDGLYKCTTCDYTNGDLETVQDHIRSHSYGQEYSCPDCDYKSVYTHNLLKHKKSHQLFSRCFTCMKCKFACSDNSELEKHMLLHTTKTFSCDKCSHVSYSVAEVLKHDAEHAASLPPVCCPDCQFNTSLQSDMKKHLLLVHNYHGRNLLDVIMGLYHGHTSSTS